MAVPEGPGPSRIARRGQAPEESECVRVCDPRLFGRLAEELEDLSKERNLLADAIARREFILAEGAVIERIRREFPVSLDPHVANASLVYEEEGRRALRTIWRSYLDVATAARLPMLFCAPTWRASPERVKLARLGSVMEVTRDAVDFARSVRDEYPNPPRKIFLGGLIGCRGDAYQAGEALSDSSAEAFHEEQASALFEAKVDLILAATLPSSSEAFGLARAISATGAPFIIGFVLRPDGTLLDNEPILDAVKRIDDGLIRPPLGYAGTCVHPEVFSRALEAMDSPEIAGRFVALQGNGSPLSPEELDSSRELKSDSPLSFAAASLSAKDRFGLAIVGGCCGTDARHIEALASLIR